MEGTAVYAVIHPDEPVLLALIRWIHRRARDIKRIQLLRLQLQKRWHAGPQCAAQLTDARARLGVRQECLLLFGAHDDVDAVAAAAVQTIQERAAALHLIRCYKSTVGKGLLAYRPGDRR